RPGIRDSGANLPDSVCSPRFARSTLRPDHSVRLRVGGPGGALDDPGTGPVRRLVQFPGCRRLARMSTQEPDRGARHRWFRLPGESKGDPVDAAAGEEAEAKVLHEESPVEPTPTPEPAP